MREKLKNIVLVIKKKIRGQNEALKEENEELKNENEKLKNENEKLKNENEYKKLRLERIINRTAFFDYFKEKEIYANRDQLVKYFEYVNSLDAEYNLSNFLRLFYRVHFIKPINEVEGCPKEMYDTVTGRKVDTNIVYDIKEIVNHFYQITKKYDNNEKNTILTEIKQGIDDNTIIVMSVPNNYLTLNKKKGTKSHVSQSDVQSIHMYYSRDENILYGIGEGKNRLIEAFIKCNSNFIESNEKEEDKDKDKALINVYELKSEDIPEDNLLDYTFLDKLNTFEGILMYEIFLINKFINLKNK